MARAPYYVGTMGNPSRAPLRIKRATPIRNFREAEARIRNQRQSQSQTGIIGCG